MRGGCSLHELEQALGLHSRGTPRGARDTPRTNRPPSLPSALPRPHAQALLYPLLVACKSQSAARRAAAMSVVDHLRQHSPVLVEQAQLVSQELIRVAILWHEMWHEALEEASRMYFGEQNVEGMLNVLAPLHALMERQGAETLQEISFMQAYGRELSEAHDWCNKYRRVRIPSEDAMWAPPQWEILLLVPSRRCRSQPFRHGGTHSRDAGCCSSFQCMQGKRQRARSGTLVARSPQVLQVLIWLRASEWASGCASLFEI